MRWRTVTVVEKVVLNYFTEGHPDYGSLSHRTVENWEYDGTGTPTSHRIEQLSPAELTLSITESEIHENGNVSQIVEKTFDPDGVTLAEEDIKRYLNDGTTLTDRDVTVYSEGKKVSFTDYEYHGGPSAGNVHQTTTKKFAADETTVIEGDVTEYRGDGETKTSRQVKEYSDGIEVSRADYEYDSEGLLTKVDKTTYAEDGTTLIKQETTTFDANELPFPKWSKTTMEPQSSRQAIHTILRAIS